MVFRGGFFFVIVGKCGGEIEEKRLEGVLVVDLELIGLKMYCLLAGIDWEIREK
jgi:hypothetical protein